MEPSQSPQKPPQGPVEIEGEKRASVGKPAGCHTTGSLLRTDAEAEQLQRRHLSEQQRLQLEQLDQLKAFKEQLLRDLFTQLSPQQTPPPPPIQSFPPSLSLPNRPQLHLSATHLCGPSVPGNPSSTPGGRGGDITSPPLTPVSTLSHTPAPSPVSRHTPDKTPTRQFPSVHSLPPPSPHKFSPSCEVSVVAKTSPPHSLPHSPTSHTPPSWSLANLLETLVPRCSERNPTQQLPFSPQGPVRDEHQLNSSQQTHSFNQTQFPVRPVPRQAWVNSGVATPPNHTRAELFQNHTRQIEDLNNSQMVQLQSANNQHENNAIPSQPLNMIPSIEDVSPPVCVDATVGRRGLEVHSHPSPPSPVPPGVASPQTQLWQGAFTRLAADNEQLKAKCTDMESRLHQCNMVNRALEKQSEKQKEYWLEWQAQAEVYTHTISVLQDKLGACRTQLKQQDGMVEQLQADLQMSVGEIQFWKEQQVQEAGKFKKLCVEFEELQTNDERLESSQASLREELMSARRELGRTEAAAKASAAKEGGLKSTIQKLEDKIRHLEHVNNRLHGQATHYSLGNCSPSHSRTSSYPNTPDDDKLWRRPRSAAHTPSSSHPPQTPTSPLSTPPPPLRHPHTSTLPQTPTSSTHHQAPRPSDSSKSSPLNRRKWLQPSDPGLILGSPSPSLPHSPPPHSHHHGSHTHYQSDITSSPLLQSTGQSIARQLSDSGSSNEGEDPASLTKQSYINSSSKNGGHSSRERDGEYSLVGSTLSAIQRGKIRTDTSTGGKSRKDDEKESVEERARRSLRVVADAGEKLEQLRREKENLETQLQRTPRHGSRVTRHSKRVKLEMEERLEVVLREIGSAKMTLRSHHAFHK